MRLKRQMGSVASGPPVVGGQCHRWRDDMIKLSFTADGGIAYRVTKPKNKQQAECVDQVGAIINQVGNINPALMLTLLIAALNGPKTLERAKSYFNVA